MYSLARVIPFCLVKLSHDKVYVLLGSSVEKKEEIYLWVQHYTKYNKSYIFLGIKLKMNILFLF